MPGLRIAVDLRGLAAPGERPHGPTRWARRLAELMAAEAGDDEVRMVEEATAPAPADVVVDLCPTLRAPGPQIPTVRAVYDISHLVAPSAHTLLERTRRGWSAALLTRREMPDNPSIRATQVMCWRRAASVRWPGAFRLQ